MTEITYEQAKEHLCSYGTAVHCEVFRQYKKWHDSDHSKFFLDRGCVIMEDEYDYNGRHYIDYKVHQCAPDGEIDAVAGEEKRKCLEHAAKYENPTAWVVKFVVSNGELTPEQNQFYGWRNYARMGHPVTPDPRVREMTGDDIPMVKAACEPWLEGDTNWSRQLAKDFYDMDYSFQAEFQENYGLYGIFDGDTLCGMANATYDPDLDLAWLLDIFVLPPHRGKGYGKALVEAALAKYPDKKWHYQAARDNAPSIALAKSLGFTLEGAGLFIV